MAENGPKLGDDVIAQSPFQNDPESFSGRLTGIEGPKDPETGRRIGKKFYVEATGLDGTRQTRIASAVRKVDNVVLQPRCEQDDGGLIHAL